MNTKKSKELLIESGMKIFNYLLCNDYENYQLELIKFGAYVNLLETMNIESQIRIDGIIKKDILKVEVIWENEIIAEFR